METTHASPLPSRRLRAAALAALVAAPTVVAVAAPSAGAGAIWGVKDIDFSVDPTPWCPAGALPLGYGGDAHCESSTVYVTQELGPDGEYHFADVVGPGGNSTVSIPTNFSAQCKSGFHLNAAKITDATIPYWELLLSVNTANRTIPGRNIDINYPISQFEHFDGHPFTPIELTDLEAEGENWLAHREIFQGIPADEVRYIPFAETYQFQMAGGVACQGNNSGEITWEGDSHMVDLTVVFLGIGQEPSANWMNAPINLPVPPFERPSTGGSGGLKVQTQVTDASLSVLADPDDSCTLHLSGVIETNGATEVSYRLIDEYGQYSQFFEVDVDQTHSALISHEVTVQPSDADGGAGLGNFAPIPGHDGDFGYSTPDTDNLQGTFRIETYSPNVRLSNVAGYNLPPCVPTPVVAIGGSADQLVVPSRPTHRS